MPILGQMFAKVSCQISPKKNRHSDSCLPTPEYAKKNTCDFDKIRTIEDDYVVGVNEASLFLRLGGRKEVTATGRLCLG